MTDQAWIDAMYPEEEFDTWGKPLSWLLCEATLMVVPEWVWKRVKEMEEKLNSYHLQEEWRDN